MKNNILRYIFIAVVIGLILYAVYYFYGKEGTENNTEENVVETEKSEEDTNLRIGISNLDTLNPLISKNRNIQDMTKLIYEPLFNITDNFKLDNALAVEWSKADSKTYLITLRENVKWHNGEDFSADDVKFTIDTIKALGDKSIYNSNVSFVDRVEIISKNLVKIYLTDQVPFFEYNLTFPIISYKFFEGEDILNSSKNNILMGTGKYKIQVVDLSSQIDLMRNPNWWNADKVNLNFDTITVRVYGTLSEVYNAYKLGGLDLIITDSIDIEDSIGVIGSNMKDNIGRNFDYLALNVTSNILSNKEVRQAINYAINKDEIVSSVYKGRYKTGDFPLSSVYYLNNENISGYEYNKDKAKQILEENGWKLSYGSWQKKIGYSTVRLRLNLVVQSSNQNRVNVANIIKKNLEEISIPVNVISANDQRYQNYLNGKNYDMILTGVSVRC